MGQPTTPPENSNPTETNNAQETAPATEQVTTEQWQNFLGNLASQNQALQSQLSQTQNYINQQNYEQRKQQINSLPAEEKAARLEQELEAIRTNSQAAQAQQISQQVWQQRDAESAARILKLHNLTGYEPDLYRASWDVNWMPRFVASVQGVVGNRANKQTQNNNAANNPANRANIGNGSGSSIPEIDLNTASGYETIRYALSRQRG